MRVVFCVIVHIVIISDNFHKYIYHTKRNARPHEIRGYSGVVYCVGHFLRTILSKMENVNTKPPIFEMVLRYGFYGSVGYMFAIIFHVIILQLSQYPLHKQSDEELLNAQLF